MCFSFKHCAAHKWKVGVTSSLVMKLDQEEVVMFAVLLNIISCKEITEPRNNSPIACKAVIAKLLSIKQLDNFGLCLNIL